MIESNFDTKVEKTKKYILNDVRQIALMSVLSMGLYILVGTSLLEKEYIFAMLYAVLGIISTKDIFGYYKDIKLNLDMLDIYAFSNGINNIEGYPKL